MSTMKKRGPGRPSLGRRKRIALNLAPALVDLIEADAERRDITVTEWLRRASLRYLERPGDEVKP